MTHAIDENEKWPKKAAEIIAALDTVQIDPSGSENAWRYGGGRDLSRLAEEARGGIRDGILFGMPSTTIKVDSAVRDRLATVARARGVTMTALLQQVSLQLAAEQEWAEIESAYGRLQRDDPAQWAGYEAELGAWDAASSDPGDAAAEWPEFNR